MWWSSFEPLVGVFWDYFEYYAPTIDNFFNKEGFYDLNYFPSFFILSPLVIILPIFIIFLSISWIVSVYFLFKIEDNYLVVLLFSGAAFYYILIGNLETFCFLILVIAYYYKENNYIPPILLSFICFKITMFLTVPYFLYKSRKKFQFLLIFAGLFLIFNIYFLFHLDYILFFITFGSDDEILYTKLIRVVVFFAAYCWIKEFYLNKSNTNSNEKEI